MAPYFADLRGVIAGTERLRAGISPLIADLHDPWNRPYNYPRCWLYTDYLGLNVHTVMAFGYGVGAGFFVAAFYVLGRQKAWEGAIAGLFFISYAVMFGVERANIDLVVFVVVALALASRRWPYLAAFFIGCAAILKLYPVFGLFALVTVDWKKSLGPILFGFAIFFIGELSSFRDVCVAMTYAPNMRMGNTSFGTTSWGLDMMDRFHRPDLYGDVIVLGSAIFLFVALVAARVRPEMKPDSFDERDIFAFRLGAGLYLGTFVLGTNHDYRLIVLLFCFPLFFHLLKVKGAACRWSVVALVLTLIYAHWALFSGETLWRHFLLKQATAWALAFCLVAFSVASLPAALQWPRRRR